MKIKTKLTKYPSSMRELPISLANFKLYNALWLAVASTMVLGCQSTSSVSPQTMAKIDATKTIYGASIDDANYLDKVTANTQAYNDLFDDKINPSVDSKAHERLLRAFNKHLTSDHVSVTQLRHHAVPFIKEGSVDEASDSLLRTIFEMFAKKLEQESYGEEEVSEPAYRDEEEYLEEPSAPYLNYMDEINGTKPSADYNIDRATGMESDFVELTDTIIDYLDETNDCVIDYSYDLDSIIADDPKLANSTSDINELKQTYEQCLTQSKTDYKDQIAKAKGYQRQYLNLQNQCIKQFDTRLGDILSPNRQPKEIDYDHYDSIYESYDICYSAVYYRYEMEPSYYLYYGLSKNNLEYKKERVLCAASLEAAHNNLAQRGITYKTNPKAYADIYYEQSDCDANAYNKVYYANDDEADISLDDTAAEADAASTEEDYDNYEDTDQLDPYNDYDYDDEESEDDDGGYGGYSGISRYSEVVDKLFNWFKRTPAQIEAANLYNYQYLSVNSVSEYNASSRQLKSVYSYDFASPTILSSMQLPIALDFTAGQVTLDPSAAMPLVAILMPEDTPLPEEMTSHTVKFELPKDVAAELPAEVVFDIFIDSVQKSLSELDSQYFTPIDVSEDVYARQIGAKRAIKLNFGSKETGEMVGGLVKHMAQGLNDYVEAHPDQFPDDSAIRAQIDKWQKLNVSYQTDDAGSILQLIEAVGPISFNKVNYYYLDSQDRLIGKQVRTKVGGDFMGSESTFLTQTRYDMTSFRKHPLARLFNETFGSTAAPAIDGNAWINKVKDRRTKLEQARYARYDYEREARQSDELMKDGLASEAAIEPDTELGNEPDNQSIETDTDKAIENRAVTINETTIYKSADMTKTISEDQKY